ncbi:MAG TPA: sucrase ferredoxin [Acidimicrobiales bacterium]|nr:sucrase ferredoxin [Acidimicrobiales bacterium]
MARERERLGCAAESLGRQELLLGTASRVRRWLLVEQPGSWGRDAIRESHLPAEVADQLHRAARAHRVRVLLVRRSVRPSSPPDARSAFLVRSDPTSPWTERVALTDPDTLLRLDLGAMAAEERPGVGEPAGPLHLVCTNGRHDPCCADLGRPVVRALREDGVDVWESSHVGGDRFAANVVCLPTGVYFGRVPPEAAPQIVRDHDAGLLALEHYRGRSCHPPLVQAAEVFARVELDERRLAELGPRSWATDGDRATVELGLGGGVVTVEVSRRHGPSVALTCGPDSSAPWRYRLDVIRQP